MTVRSHGVYNYQLASTRPEAGNDQNRSCVDDSPAVADSEGSNIPPIASNQVSSGSRGLGCVRSVGQNPNSNDGQDNQSLEVGPPSPRGEELDAPSRTASKGKVGVARRRGKRQRRRGGRSLSDDGSLAGSTSTYGEKEVLKFASRPGRQALPNTEPLYNKLSKRTPIWSGVRNIKIGHDVVSDRFKVGRMMRMRHKTIVDCYEGRRSKTYGASIVVTGGHHYGTPCAHSPQLSSARIVYIDVRKVHWATIGGVAFQGSAWPRIAKKCKSIVRTLFANHCQWADVLVVRGRCFCSHSSCHAGNRILENLLWHWNTLGRPFIVYKEGSTHTGGGTPVPKWLEGSRCYCSDFYQCNLVSQCEGAWHHPGQLYSNVPALNLEFDKASKHYTFKCDCDYSK